jgi:endonuclease/exonuclease/phosphatase family metal-dependent hydrolase
MATVRVATFNVENLFARWKFELNVDPSEAIKNGWTVDETKFDELSVDERALTGKAVRELDADILVLEEVENVDTLKHFRAGQLGGRSAYPYVAGIDGNDPRLIDVAVLSKLPITRVRSNQHLMDPATKTTPLFSRDCLEVDVATDSGPITLYVNHFKSMLDRSPAPGSGRHKTHDKHQRQADAVKEIIVERHGTDVGDAAFIVLGDFNDYLATDADGTTTAIAGLVEWDQVENVVTRRADDDQWTHFFDAEDEYQQLDYMLLSKSLAERTGGEPEITRKGMPLAATRSDGERFVGVGQHKPIASDHCPVVMAVDVG